MSRLVIIRVGDQDGLWATAVRSGVWSSPECHSQAVRSAFVEGYKVVVLFLGTGDVPLLVGTVSNVRKRHVNEAVIPQMNELGNLTTIIEFNNTRDLNSPISTMCEPILPIIRYKIGSQIQVLGNEAMEFLVYYAYYSRINREEIYSLNTTFTNPSYF